MITRYVTSGLFALVCLSLSAAAQANNRFDDNSRYAYKNYVCKTTGTESAGYGRPIDGGRTIEFQIKPGGRKYLVPKNQCHRINVMRIQRNTQ